MLVKRGIKRCTTDRKERRTQQTPVIQAIMIVTEISMNIQETDENIECVKHRGLECPLDGRAATLFAAHATHQMRTKILRI